MSRHLTQAITLASATLALFFASSASAQMTPGGGGGAGGPTGPDSETSDSDGVAEQAPKKLGALPTTPILPPPKEASKELRVFSLDGYFRLRTDWMKQMDLGFTDDPSLGGAPFPNPLACRDIASAGSCENSFGAANTRLRLEPIIHLDERSSVHMQIDLLDNLVLGSTRQADGGSAQLPAGAFGDRQAAPLAGVNSAGDSLVVKRAWAEVDAPFGLLKFGRQPWQWGMGMVANAGGNDPIHGEYNLDADDGDTVDRVTFSAPVPGTELNAGLAVDWAQNGPTSAQAGEAVGTTQAFDLDDADDLDQWLFTISRMDSPDLIADRLADGESIFNYGAFLAYRTMSNEQLGDTFGETPDPADYTKRSLKVYVPDLWVHFAKGQLDLEAEGVAVLGSISATDLGIANDVSIRQFGGVGRLRYKMMDGDLHLGLETGFASGDQQDNEVPGRTHVSGAQGLGPGDNKLRQFIFDNNFHVDLILFRELMGAVSNAMYAKPSFTYDLTSKFSASAAGIVSLAHKPVATPGNSTLYGVEFDADIGYRNNGFFAGIAYGVLLPLAALDHPAQDEFGFGANAGEAGIAQTIQTRLVLQF